MTSHKYQLHLIVCILQTDSTDILSNSIVSNAACQLHGTSRRRLEVQP